MRTSQCGLGSSKDSTRVDKMKQEEVRVQRTQHRPPGNSGSSWEWKQTTWKIFSWGIWSDLCHNLRRTDSRKVPHSVVMDYIIQNTSAENWRESRKKYFKNIGESKRQWKIIGTYLEVEGSKVRFISGATFSSEPRPSVGRSFCKAEPGQRFQQPQRTGHKKWDSEPARIHGAKHKLTGREEGSRIDIRLSFLCRTFLLSTNHRTVPRRMVKEWEKCQAD